MISGKLIKSSAIYTVIGALPLVSGFFLLIFYTNYLTKTDYGALVLYIGFTGFIQILANMGLDAYIGISYFDHRHEPDLLRDRLGHILGFLLIWGLIILLINSVLGDNIFSLVFSSNNMTFYPYGLMSVITAFTGSYFKTFTNLLINQERVQLFMWVNIAHFVMIITFSLTGLFLFPFTLIGPMWGRFLSGTGIFILASIFLRNDARITIPGGENLKAILRFSLPLLVFLLMSWSIANIYPFIMEHHMPLHDVAIFGLAIQFTLLVEFILNGLSSAIIPKVFGMIKEHDLTGSNPEINKFFSGFNAVSLLIIPASTFFIPLILPIFINKDYETSFLFLSALNIGFASRGLYNYFLTPIYLFKKTNVLPLIYLITAIIQIGSALLLIKFCGIWGAVAANLLTKIVQNLVLYLASRKFFDYHFNAFKFIWLPLLVTMLILASEYFITRNNLHYIRLLQMLITYLLVWIFYRAEVAALVQTLKARYVMNKK